MHLAVHAGADQAVEFRDNLQAGVQLDRADLDDLKREAIQRPVPAGRTLIPLQIQNNKLRHAIFHPLFRTVF